MSDAGGPRDGDFELVTLRNGHRAVRHLPSGEVMHPSVGPWAEANLLYIDQTGLKERLQTPGAPVRILDVGLGAGTNALAAIECAESLGSKRERGVEILSFERDLGPLRLAVGDAPGFAAQARWAGAARELIERGVWTSDGIHWRLLLGEFLERLAAVKDDVPAEAEFVFYDPFSPAVNPELWSVAAFRQLRERCADRPPGALVATYSAATPTRLSLLLAGFFVGTGVAVGSKAETTIAATRLETLRAPLGDEFLARWRRSTARAPHGESYSPELEARLLAHPQFNRR